MSEKKINYEKRPMPSGPGAGQITVQGNKCMQGGKEMVSPLPKENMIKEGKK